MNNKTFHGFLIQYQKTVVDSSQSFLPLSWQELENTWTSKFLSETEKLDKDTFKSLKEKVHFFFIQQRWATPKQAQVVLGEVQCFDTGNHSRCSLLRCSNFVVGNSLLILEEELIMYLPLLLETRTFTIPYRKGRLPS